MLSENLGKSSSGAENQLASEKSTEDKKNVWKEFRLFLTDFQSGAAIVGKLSIAAPLIDFVVNIGPPWPSRVTVTFLSAMVQFLLLLFAFEFWLHHETDTEKLKRVRLMLRRAITIVLPLLLLIYLFLFSNFIREEPDMWHREVAGWKYTEKAEKLLETNNVSEKELLSYFGGDPTKVWVASSLNTMRVIVLFSWLLLVVGLASVIALFVSIQWLRQQDHDSS